MLIEMELAAPSIKQDYTLFIAIYVATASTEDIVCVCVCVLCTRM